MTSASRKPNDPPPPTLDFGGEEQAELLVRILDGYLAELRAGRHPDRAALLAAHPKLADQLTACLAGLEFIQGAESAGRGDRGELASSRTLGDFRILREVGRGGMGAVYEAEQISLGRRVALKVLRFGGVSDPEALDRFRREAETVARLHHTNIVPIFAVGSDQGVNFYAMQFIEGQSLAEVLASADQRLATHDVMSWGLQASEALTHAHERHVIHRDVKPSNLLLDEEGRIWLTDFGLARRLDDVTLSMTGALLGTPRYMSPEQASATRRNVDRRTDIYSLGATLYELLTGRPAFTGDSPHQVIQQILTTEPVPLRTLRPDISRDLETVVMKCLTKNADRRYATARELADDLRACLERRPIRARRANIVERATRWLQGRRQGVRISAIAVASTLLLVATVLIGWRSYDASRQISLQLTTLTPPLSAELSDDAGGITFSAAVPTERPLVVRDGEYLLRASSTDRWSQTFQVSLRRGAAQRLDVSMEDQQLWSPTQTARWFAVVEDAAGAALLHLNDEGVACESGTPKVMRWKQSLVKDRPAALQEWPGLSWPWFPGANSANITDGPTMHAPWVVPRTIDVNGDGTGDYLLAARHQAFVVAFSGTDGAVLWAAARGRDLLRQPDRERSWSIRSTVVGCPSVIEDQDGDRIPDLVVTWADTGDDPSRPTIATGGPGNVCASQRSLELLSGASGKAIWTSPLDDRLFELPEDGAVPDEFQWFVGHGYGVSSGSSGSFFTSGRHFVRSENRHFSRSGTHVYVPTPPRPIRVAGHLRLAVVAGERCLLFDPADGKLLYDDRLPARPDRPGSWGDVDGDGVEDLIWTARRPPAPGLTHTLADIAAWSVAKRSSLWTISLAARFPHQESWMVSPATWPHVVDLNGDGAAEVIAPDGNSAAGALGKTTHVPWGEIVVLDGKSGGPLWRKRVCSGDQQVEHLSAGPDIDGDGHREIYAATLAGVPLRAYVDCLSGRDGSSLWTSPVDFRPGSDHYGIVFTAPTWWNAGEDGWPQWIVLADGLQDSLKGTEAFAVSAGTGRVLRVRRNVSHVRSVDVDADGVEDLVSYQALELNHPEDGGAIDCVRGVAAEPWNRLGAEGVPAADYNRDGIRDLLRSDLLGRVAAVCGKSGAVLWENRLPGANTWRLQPLLDDEHAVDLGAGPSRASDHSALADLDGDGITDILAWQTRQFGSSLAPFAALSGRTGDKLWSADELSSRVAGGLFARRLVDLDRDGSPELAIVYAGDIGYPPRRLALSTGDLQWWLIVVSARTGRVRWKVPISEAYGNSGIGANGTAPGAFPLRSFDQLWELLHSADLNGDGTFDVISPALAATGDRLEFRAHDGRDGALLWTHSLPPEKNIQDALFHQHALRIADLDGDGRSEVLVMERTPITERVSNDFVPLLRALDGADGKARWRWTGPPLPIPNQPFHLGERRGVSDIVLLRGANGGIRPAFSLTGDPGTIIVVEGPERVATLALPRLDPTGRLWPCDSDGDGDDELALVIQGDIWLLDPAQPDAPRWKRGTASERFSRILEVRAPTGEFPAEIVGLCQSGDNSAVAIDASTGRMRWRCAGPIPRDRQSYVLPQTVTRLDTTVSGRPPLVFFQYNQTSHCRQAVSASEGAGRSGAAEPVVSASRPVRDWSIADPLKNPAGSRPRRDLRWARDLPWHVPEELTVDAIPQLLGCGFLSLTLVIAPYGFIRRLIRRRQWGLRSMFVAPILVAVATLVTIGNPPVGMFGDDGGLPGAALRWLIAVVSTPPVVFLGRLVEWMVWRQWRRAAFWLVGVVALSAALAGIGLWAESVANPLEPDEYYVADGWYMILPLSFYFLSWPNLPLVSLADWWCRRVPGSEPEPICHS